MKIVAISDTHQVHRQLVLPSADIIIHAGDAGIDGTKNELEDFIDWFKSLPYPFKIMVGGNHDEWLEDHPEIFDNTKIEFLWDRFIEIRGLKIYGSPWRIVSDDRMKITEKRIAEAGKDSKPGKGGNGRSGFMITETWAELIWKEIPDNLDILITHQPPFGVMDFDGKKSRGSQALLSAVRTRKIDYHIFGHVHPEHGIRLENNTCFINATICDDYAYRIAWEPVVISLSDDGSTRLRREKNG